MNVLFKRVPLRMLLSNLVRSEEFAGGVVKVEGGGCECACVSVEVCPVTSGGLVIG